MRAEELVELLRARPFVPLRIVMTDGRTYDIQHPGTALVLRERVDIGIRPDPETGVVESVERCPLSHIVRAERVERSS